MRTNQMGLRQEENSTNTKIDELSVPIFLGQMALLIVSGSGK